MFNKNILREITIKCVLLNVHFNYLLISWIDTLFAGSEKMKM